MRFQRRIGTIVGVAGLGAILLATLTPTNDLRGVSLRTPLLCLICGDEGGADVINNLLLFLPLAVGLRLSGQSWRRTVIAGALLSFTVELLQYWVVPDRDASLSDLLTNTASSALGAGLGTALPYLAAPSTRLAHRLLAGGLVALTAILALWGWLLMPWAPQGPLLSLWADESRGFGEFSGQVRWVRIDGRPMPRNGSPPDAGGLRTGLAHGTLTLDAELTSGTPGRDRLWIYMLRRRVPSNGEVTLSQAGTGAGIRLPTRSLHFRLTAPTITLGNAFPRVAGEPVRLRATSAGGRVTLASSYGGGRSVELGLSPAFGWSLLLPFEVGTGTGVRWMTGLVLVLLLLPLGYWAAWTRYRSPSAALVALAIVTALAGLPAMVGLPPVHWSEWLAAALGAATGWALQRPAAYLQNRCRSPSDSAFSSS